MNSLERIRQKICSIDEAVRRVAQWRCQGERIVFTNGCFDLLHYGHIHYLSQARDLGHRLVVGLNSSTSVHRLKGPHRPINDEQTRTHALAALEVVDAVVLFDEDTPLYLIEALLPDVLVKGGDWAPEHIVGASVVLAHGGRVLSLPFVEGYSTTRIEQKIREAR
jgi:D-beta-D-heptose 7-phosphate kinase/D-beta-D-heptose 1-phosphate adenosyltransferase